MFWVFTPLFAIAVYAWNRDLCQEKNQVKVHNVTRHGVTQSISN